MSFQVVEDVLRNIFLPSLFQGATSQILRRVIKNLLSKKAGISLPESTWTAGVNCTESCMITGHLVTALCGTAEFRSGNHALLMGEGREEIRQRHAEEADNTLGEARTAASKSDTRRLGRIQQKGAWLSVIPSTVNGTELGVQE